MKNSYFLFLFLVNFSLTAQDTIYVNNAIPLGNGSGDSWYNPKLDLRLALALANPGDQIWVAKGTYTPVNTASTNRDLSFVVHKGISLYGGFAGMETDLSQRNIADNPTILSGEIGDASDLTDNVYHVVKVKDTQTHPLIDGFIIENGYAEDQHGFYNDNCLGGGIFVETDEEYSEGRLTITNCNFQNNTAHYGGGIYVKGTVNGGTDLLVQQSNFRDNQAIKGSGGAIFKRGKSYYSTQIMEVNFENNTASVDGGAVVLDNSIGDNVLLNCTFTENEARAVGGGLYVYSDSDDQLLTIKDGVFTENKSGESGAIGFDLRTFANQERHHSIIIEKTSFLKNEVRIVDGGIGLYGTASVGSIDLAINQCIFDQNASGIGLGVNQQTELALTVRNTAFKKNGHVVAIHINNQEEVSGIQFLFSNCLFYDNGRVQLISNDSERNIISRYNNCTFYQNGYQVFSNVKHRDNSKDTIHINNSILWEDTLMEQIFPMNERFFTKQPLVIQHSLLSTPNCLYEGENLCDSTNLFHSPDFSNPALEDFTLLPCSPAIDAGNDLYYDMEASPFDLATTARIKGEAIDLGAYESPSLAEAIDSIIPYPVACFGGNNGKFEVVGKLCEPLTFQWASEGVSGTNQAGLKAAFYELTITDGQGKTVHHNFEIKTTEPITFLADITPATNNTSNDGIIKVEEIHGGRPPYFLEWSNGFSTDSIAGLMPDNYFLTITDYYDCQVTDSLTVTALTTSTIATDTKKLFQIYPNPFYAGNLVLALPAYHQPIELSIFRISGALVLQRKPFFLNQAISLDLPKGVYVVRVIGKDFVLSKKLLVGG